MENRVESAPVESHAHVIGRPVVDAAGVILGVVVGRIISGATIDLLVRRRRLFHRSRYLRLAGADITVSGPALMYHAGSPGRATLAVVTGDAGDDSQGDAA